MLKKFFLGIIAVLGGIYLLFLLMPFLLIPFTNGIITNTLNQIEKETGFKAAVEKFRLITSPDLSAGVKSASVKIYTPDNEILLSVENPKIKMSLASLFLRKIKFNLVSSDNLELNLPVKSNGEFLIFDYIKDINSNNTDNASQADTNSSQLPFGIKLSNTMPDIKIAKYTVNFTQGAKNYILQGSDTLIDNFVINKKIKIKSKGTLTLDDFEAFSYDIKLFNKIMPDIDLNDLAVNNNENNVSAKKEETSIDVIQIFKDIKNNGIRASLSADINSSGTVNEPNIRGNLNLDKMSLKTAGNSLPDSSLSVVFNNNEYTINSILNSGLNENTKIDGKIKTGKKSKIDLNFKSNATLKNICRISDTIMRIFGVNDLKTLSAKGNLNADFNIKSDFKKINSNGSIKLLDGMVAWGVYDVKLDNLKADISLDNDTVSINNLGFSTLSIPFNIQGKIKHDASVDIDIQTKGLPIKGLLLSFGMGTLLHDNPISSGTVSISAQITDKLLSPKINGNISVDKLALTNTPSNTKFSLDTLLVNLQSEKSDIKGNMQSSNIKAVNPSVTVSMQSLNADITNKTVTFSQTPVYAGKNLLNISGKISDFMTNKIGLDFVSKGDIQAALNGHINLANSSLDLKTLISDNSKLIIPGFDKSTVTLSGSADITGDMLNPLIKGQFKLPSVEIPEIPVSISNMTANLNGTILNGNVLLDKFTTGGIAAQNTKSDFKMDGNMFYLNNLQGSAFDGSFNGDISCNLSNEKCKVLFSGDNMSALKAIEGAAGIKNAMTGTLNFSSDFSFEGYEYNDMMKSLSGDVDFQINNGTLGNLGGLKSFLNAQNILGSSVLKSVLNSVTSLSAVDSASDFDYLKGSIELKSGFANLNPVEMSGASMAYYVTGKYNLLTAYTDVIILGRLSESVVGVLGSLGDLSSGKITSIISGLGNLTSSLAKNMNESPKNVDTSKIPSLKSSNTASKMFKVVFTGPITGAASVKSFKWLNDVDTSGIETTGTVNKTVQNALENVKLNTTQAKEDLKETGKQAKQLFKSILNGTN
ncbi:MAG: hypothetical protein LUE64_02525 [Candidatus Gastranaerophilales bacterium]|nr:hypothetical protein [Candidatus Gastranaerophilales bacterium]